MPDNLNPTAVPTTSAIGQPVRFRGGGFTVKRHPWAALAAFAVLIALWEGASRLGLASPLFLPPPSAVGHALAGMVMDGSLWLNLKASLARIAALPPRTVLYSAHEYTLASLKFAESLGGDDALRARGERVRRLRAEGRATVPATVAEELATNPFLVWPLSSSARTRPARHTSA